MPEFSWRQSAVLHAAQVGPSWRAQARLVPASPPNWHGLGGTAVGQAAQACLALEADDPGLRAFATNPRGCLYGSELSCIQTSLAIAIPAIRLFCRVLALAVDQVGVCGVVPCP